MAEPFTFSRASQQVSSFVTGTTDSVKKRLEERASNSPDAYEQAVVEYNAAFTSMNDQGLTLLRQRERSTDLIALVEHLVNSIANTPKTLTADFAEITAERENFTDAEEFARKDLDAARKSAAGAGAGLTAGAAVASMAPSAALWVATTFGTASTGTAISTLSGAAASKAALAWLGGGALAAGGGGTATGATLLALSGPIGWSIAGATLLTSIVLLTVKTSKNRDARQEALESVTHNTATVRILDAQITALLTETTHLRERLTEMYRDALDCLNADFRSLDEAQRTRLATLVNNTKACARLLGTQIEPSAADPTVAEAGAPTGTAADTPPETASDTDAASQES